MKYNVSFKLTNPEKTKSFMVRGIFEIYESGAFAYGNQKGLHMNFSQCREVMGSDMNFDIRYDTRYSSQDEPAYIKTFVKDQWSGQNGSWKASYVTVKTIFELEGSMTYKDFSIEKLGAGKWGIHNLNGVLLRTCKTKKECIERIDNQTV